MPTEIKIDPGTGLPELPEGQVWNVSRSPGVIDSLVIEIQEAVTEPSWSTWMPVHLFLVDEDILDVEFRTVNNGRDWLLRKLAIKEKRLLSRPRPRVIYAHTIELYGVELTASIIHAAAVAIAEHMAAREKAEAFIGTYPPKRLEVEGG